MIVRTAQTADAAAIAELVNPVIERTTITFSTVKKSVEAVATGISTLPCFLVAENEKGILGFVFYSQFRKCDGCTRDGALDCGCA